MHRHRNSDPPHPIGGGDTENTTATDSISVVHLG